MISCCLNRVNRVPTGVSRFFDSCRTSRSDFKHRGLGGECAWRFASRFFSSSSPAFNCRRHCPTVSSTMRRFGSEGLLAPIFLPVARAGLRKINKPSGFRFRTSRLRSTISSPAPPDRQKISAPPFRTFARTALHSKSLSCFAVTNERRRGEITPVGPRKRSERATLPCRSVRMM